MHAFEQRDVYNPHRPSPVVRLELVSAQYAHCLIDALEGKLLAFPMGDRFVHFIVSDKAPLRETLPDYTPTIDRKFYIWGLTCCVVKLSDSTCFILPPADHMATTFTDSLNYQIEIVYNMYCMRRAPAGGAAAAAPEGGALACPSAPTSTSTRWALVTP
jgi:hypothetical protein